MMTLKEADKFIADWQKAQIRHWVMETRFLCLLAIVIGYFIGVFTS